MTKKEQVKKLLEEFSKIDKKKIPTKDNGHTIDTEKFFQVKEVKELLAELKKLKIKSLCKMGFVAAGLLLDRELN